VIHKFKCNDQDWAVILGELEFQEWRLWGYVPDDQPEATYYNRKVALSSSHAPSTSISGQEKRAAQQSINPIRPQHASNSAAGNDNDEGEHMESEDSSDQSVRITHGKRRRSRRSKSPDRVSGHRRNSQSTPQRSRTPAPQRIAQRSTRGSNPRMDNRTHNTTTELPQSISSPPSMDASKRTGIDSNALVSNPNDLPHSDRHTPSSKDTWRNFPTSQTQAMTRLFRLGPIKTTQISNTLINLRLHPTSKLSSTRSSCTSCRN
jgi:hypothetical protein